MVRRNAGYWVYHSLVTGQAGQGAGDISWTITPAPGDVFELLYGAVVNKDSAGRVLNVRIDDGTAGEIIGQLVNTLTVGAGDEEPFPANEAANHGPGQRYIIVNPMRLVAILSAVAQAEDASIGVLAKCSTVPTVVTGGAGTEVVTELTDQLM